MLSTLPALQNPSHRSLSSYQSRIIRFASSVYMHAYGIYSLGRLSDAGLTLALVRTTSAQRYPIQRYFEREISVTNTKFTDCWSCIINIPTTKFHKEKFCGRLKTCNTSCYKCYKFCKVKKKFKSSPNLHYYTSGLEPCICATLLRM